MRGLHPFHRIAVEVVLPVRPAHEGADGAEGVLLRYRGAVKLRQTQREENLQSPNSDVVDAANAWGSPGDHNGVTLTFKSQQALEQEAGITGADANTQPRVRSESPGTPDIHVSVSVRPREEI